MIYSVDELITCARQNSPFYRELYTKLPEKISLTDLPIIDQKKFWSSNTFNGNKLLTADFGDGILFKSGGTTGKPKFSAFTKSEWETFTSEFGRGISHGFLKKSDRVGNLFYSGDLYASFLFITDSLRHDFNSIIQFPMTGAMSYENIMATVEEYKINVLAGVPTTFINLANYILENSISHEIDLILFGGESLYEDQLHILKRAFPKAKITSIGIASVDGGHLGYFDEGCENGEHKVFLESTIVEIIDEDSGEVIQEKGRTGRLIYTNLTRKLMPIIRYPAGDMAEWTEYDMNNGLFRGLKYKLHGRSNEGARIGPVTVGSDDILNIFNFENLGQHLSSFQLLVKHQDGLDQLTILLVPEEKVEKSEEELNKLFYRERPMFKDVVDKNIVSPIKISIVEIDQLKKNPRTGKHRLVVDLREDVKIN